MRAQSFLRIEGARYYARSPGTTNPFIVRMGSSEAVSNVNGSLLYAIQLARENGLRLCDCDLTRFVRCGECLNCEAQHCICGSAAASTDPAANLPEAPADHVVVEDSGQVAATAIAYCRKQRVV